MESKNRHGCVTTWLILMIVGNSLTAFGYLLAGPAIMHNISDTYSEFIFFGMAAIGIANLVFSIQLFLWKKWAFWAFAGAGFLTLGVNLAAGVGIYLSLFGLSGAAVLYAILQIKQDGKTAWELLE